MNFLDIRTVVFSQLITDALCTVVLIFFWRQHQKRYAGMFFWVIDLILQTTAVLLIMLRGSIPDWASIGLSSPLVIAGAFLGYLGLERFVGKRSSQVYNYIFLVVFVLAHIYFAEVKPNLGARNLNVSLGLLVICAQCAWLMRWRAGRGLPRITTMIGWVFALFGLVSLIRIFVILASPAASNDFFQSGLYDTLILMAYQSLLILLTFGLALMVNSHLLVEVQIQEEKFSKAFHSSPYAIVISRLSDGVILDVNRVFSKITGYLPAEAIGKTSLDLRLWVNEMDLQQTVAELSARGEVQGKEYQFRAKSGSQLTGMLYAEILAVEDEQLVLSSLYDLTESKHVEELGRESAERYRSLFENMLNGFAYCQMIYTGDCPQDFIYLDVNRAFEILTGLKDVVGKRVSEVIPGIREADPGLFEIYGRVALTGQPEIFETYVEALKMWFSISVYSPEKGFFVAVFDVITERKLAEEKLREDEARLHLALDAAKGGAWEWNLQTNDNIWSEELWKVYGLQPHSCAPSYESWLQTVHPDDQAGAAQAVQKAAREASELYVEWRVPDRDGGERWLMSRGQPLFNADGQPVKYIGTVLDITERKRVEEALLDSEARYRHTLDAMLEGCQIIGFDWRYLYLNDVANQHNRRPMEELLGKIYMDMWPGIESTEVFTVIRRCMEERIPQSMENEFVFPDGGIGWFELRIYPVPEGIVILSIDITERKQAEEMLRASEERYRTVADYTHDWEYWIAPDGKLLYMSPSCERVTGYRVQEFMDDSSLLARIVVPDDRFLHDEHNSSVRHHQDGQKVHEVDFRILRRDGETRWIGHTCQAIRREDGTSLGRRATNRDITERKQAEESLNKLNSELEQRVLARTAQLEIANKELETFSYSVSHDLRAPLRGIDGWGLALLEDYGDCLDEQGRKYLARVRSETQRMGQLIDDLLQLSRVSRTAVQKGPVDLSDNVREIAARLKEAQPARQLEFIIQPGLTCLGDARLIDVALTNLLDNAVKFTAKQARAIIEFGEAVIDGKPAYFVHDNGVGFDMAYADKLFGAFQRMHKTSEFPGSGIGLATVQRIIHLHGGLVWVEATVGRGATFYFTLGEVL